MNLDAARKASEKRRACARLFQGWRNGLRDSNPCVVAGFVRKVQAIAEANAAARVLQPVQLRAKLSTQHGRFQLEPQRPALQQFGIPLHGHEDRHPSRLPVPAFAAGVLENKLLTPWIAITEDAVGNELFEAGIDLHLTARPVANVLGIEQLI